MNLDQWKQRLPAGVCLVHFLSSMRALCKEQMPAIDELSGEFGERVRVLNIDVETQQWLAIHLGVASLPTLIIFRNGRELTRFIGLQDAADLKKALLEALGP